MGMLQLPRRMHPDFMMPGVKPLGSVEINWEHPLADGLVFYSIGDVDLVSGAIPTPVAAYSATQSNVTYGEHGLQLNSKSLTDGGFRYARPDGALSRLDGSVFVTVASLTALDIASGNGKLLCIPWHITAWNSPWVSCAITQKSLSVQNCDFEIAVGGSFTKAQSNVNYFVLDGQFYLYSITKNDTLTGSFYRNGALFSANVGDTGFDGAIDLSAQNNIYVQSRNDAAGDQGTDGRCALSAIWAREFTAAEHAAFYADPYALLQPKVSAVYFTAGAGVPTGTVTQTLKLFTQVGNGVVHPTGIGTQTLSLVTQVGAGGQKFIAAAAQTLQALAQDGTGLMHPDGIGAQALPLLAQVGVGSTGESIGVGAQTLQPLAQAGVGAATPSGTGASLLAALAQAGAGVHTETATGAAAQTLTLLSQAGIAQEIFIATGAQLTADLSQAASGIIAIPGSGAQVLPLLAQVGVGIEHPNGSGAQTLLILTQLGSGVFTSAFDPPGFTITGAPASADIIGDPVGVTITGTPT